jgi:hypothetical protein
MIERILQVIDYYGINKNKFYKKTGLSNGFLDKVKNIGSDKIDKILNSFPEVDSEWLISGHGDMIKKPNNLDLVKNHLKNESESLSYKTDSEILVVNEGSELYGNKKVPYYDLDFTSGFLEVENNQQTVPSSYISHPFFAGCDMVVRNSGQSMAKVIAHGDAIGLVRLNNWRDFFPFGEIYAIVTSDRYRMIKVITKGENENSYTLISKPTDSKKHEFPDQQIKKDSILYLFKVQASSHLF